MEVGADGDAEVGGGAEDVEGASVADLLEALAVHLEDLVAALQAHLLRLRALRTTTTTTNSMKNCSTKNCQINSHQIKNIKQLNRCPRPFTDSVNEPKTNQPTNQQSSKRKVKNQKAKKMK